MIKDPNEMTSEERMEEIISIFAKAVIRFIESNNHQENYLDNERSCTRLLKHSKRSCVRKNRKERIDED